MSMTAEVEMIRRLDAAWETYRRTRKPEDESIYLALKDAVDEWFGVTERTAYEQTPEEAA